MEQVRAVVVDPQAAGRLAIRPMAVRAPLPFEALVRVKAVSLNLGEVRRALTMAEPGWRPGWDLAGVIEQAAANHSVPAAGARMVCSIFMASMISNGAPFCTGPVEASSATMRPGMGALRRLSTPASSPGS